MKETGPAKSRTAGFEKMGSGIAVDWDLKGRDCIGKKRKGEKEREWGARDEEDDSKYIYIYIYFIVLLFLKVFIENILKFSYW